MADGKDSQSKQFGDTFLDKLEGQLDQKAPVFNKSLFVGAGQGTRNAWDAGNDFAGGLNDAGGFGYGQRGAMDGLGGLGGKYGALGGAYDPNSDAYKRLRQGIADDTMKEVGSQFTASGRFGGGSHVSTAAEGLGDALAGLDYGNMQNDINNRYRSLDSQRSIFGDQFGMGQQALGNQMGAIDRLTGIGGAQDANRQGQRLGNADLFDRRHNAELDRLLKIGAGFGDPVGAANQPNWWQSGLGALLGFGGSALSGGLFGGGS
jgi:hypothetical protein